MVRMKRFPSEEEPCWLGKEIGAEAEAVAYTVEGLFGSYAWTYMVDRLTLR